MNYPVLVLAGGRGTRMRAVTQDRIPKCMLDVGGKPFIIRQTEWLHRQGLTDITYSLGWLGSCAEIALWAYDWANKWHPKVTYAHDCGIQGAVRQAKMRGPFYLLYGDVLPKYSATDLDPWSDCWDTPPATVMGKCADYYDTGFSLIMPGFCQIQFIDVAPSLEIGSMQGYEEMRKYFGDYSPIPL